MQQFYLENIFCVDRQSAHANTEIFIVILFTTVTFFSESLKCSQSFCLATYLYKLHFTVMYTE